MIEESRSVSALELQSTALPFLDHQREAWQKHVSADERDWEISEVMPARKSPLGSPALPGHDAGMAETIQARLSARQKRFAGLVVEGMSQCEAYEKVYGKKEATYASRLTRKPSVAAEIARLQAEAAAACSLKHQELVGFLVSVIMTPVGHLGPDDLLVQEWTEVETKGGKRRTLKGINKLGAAKLLACLLGWMRPDHSTNEAGIKIVLKKLWED